MKRRWHIGIGALLILLMGAWHCLSPLPGSWRETGHLLWPRTQHQALLLGDGRVLVYGGSPEVFSQGRTSIVPNGEVFDPKSELWTSVGMLGIASCELGTLE